MATDAADRNVDGGHVAGANARRVHAMWIAGTSATPVPMTVTARAGEGYDVRISVLGPIANGTRPTLGADGYSAAKRTARVVFNATKKGEYRVVQIQLGNALANHAKPLEVEAWANPPMLPWTAKKVATGAATGTAVSITLPTTVKAGDDLNLVVREKSGRVLHRRDRTDDPHADIVRTDRRRPVRRPRRHAGRGCSRLFEGQATMRLRSETKKRDMDDVIVKATRPGQVGNGLNAFDAHGCSKC